MAENFKILTPRAHVRERVGMYLGSVSKDTIERFVKGIWGSYTYVPALFKMVNEIIDNSIDEALRTNFKHANLIDVSIDQTSGSITVSDNGRGIPQNLIKDTVTGEDILQPVAAWTKTNAGTSFTEDRVTIGSNGVGSAATNFLSKSFVGTTWSNGSCVTVSCSNGAETISVSTSKKSGSGTVVSFQPDFAFFETSSVFDDDLIALVEDRLISLQLAFPEISFSFNKKKIPITDIKKYAQLFTKDGASVIIEKTDNVSYFFAASEDGFRTNSFLNGVNTYLGGTYVDYIMNAIVDELVVLIKKKHKIEVNKSTIKSGLSFVLFVRNFVNPKFDSQTKERLTSSAGSAREHYEKSGAKDLKQIARKIFAADDIIEPLIAAQIAKKNADELRDAKVAQKKLKKVRVAKHISATSPEASLALCEGDCIEENTQIHTLNGSKAIKDIQIGDYVFTHKNRYQPVESKSFALKEGIRLNGIIYSQNHRLFVYDTKDRKFKIKHVKDIDRNTDKIIKNRLIKNDFDSMMNIVESVSDDGVVVTNKKIMKFSKDHEILYLTDELSIETRVFLDLIPGDVIIL